MRGKRMAIYFRRCKVMPFLTVLSVCCVMKFTLLSYYQQSQTMTD